MQVLLSEQQSLKESNSGVKDEKMQIFDKLQNLLNSTTEAKTKPVSESYSKAKCTHTPYPGISQLLPNLYLCGAGVVVPHVLDKLEVRFIINVAPELPNTPLSSITKPLYLRVNALDSPKVDLSVHFDEVSDMIEEVHQQGGKTLIHCVAGVSRSATLCIAYLMKYRDMSLREAFMHVKNIRPQIRPNTGFFQQLRQYEERLHGSCSVKMIYYASLDREIPDVYESEYRAMEDFYQRQRKTLKQR